MLTAEQTRRLARLQGDFSSYEVAAVTPDGRRLLAGYTQRKSRRGMLSIIQMHGDAWANLILGPDGECDAVFGKNEIRFADWRFIFTGRTEREAIITGELPWFKDAA